MPDSDAPFQSTSESVSQWIDGIKDGNRDAIQQIWERYSKRLEHLASRQMGYLSRRVSDEQDVAQSVFKSLYFGAADGRFTQLANRDDLWRLLIMITRKKVIDLRRYHFGKKRDQRRTIGESEVTGATAQLNSLDAFHEVIRDEPTPEDLVGYYDQLTKLMELLPDNEEKKYREIAQRRLEGYFHEEIAVQLGLSRATVERRMKIIRQIWDRELHRSAAQVDSEDR